ncbi:MAG TPA: DUF5615 family PIN-like protein [Hyphomicrobiaceae bacterium]|nr:DUF5615 family PIN-like protein [Hyphomicrobiaceae bacterium]
MSFRLGENLGYAGKTLLAALGHDAMTVADQRLSGVQDEAIYNVAAVERRALITLERDFGEVLRIPPEPTEGIIVLICQGRLS